MIISDLKPITALAFLVTLLTASSAFSQASGTNEGNLTGNSLTILDNSTNRLTAFLFPNGNAWFSSNIWIGQNNVNYVTAPEFGPLLIFGGATGNNTDAIAFYRFNKAPNITEFRLMIGDDVNNATQCNQAGDTCLATPDTFAIGGIDFATQSWISRFTFTTTGAFGVGTETPQAAVDVKGEVRIGTSGVACASNNQGALRYDATQSTNQFQYCNGSSWVALAKGRDFAVPIGQLSALTPPPATCNSGNAILSNGAFGAICTAACHRWCLANGSGTGTITEFDIVSGTAVCSCF